MNRPHLDATIAALEIEQRVIAQSIVKLKALRDATPPEKG